MDTIDLVLHPVRLRITHAMADGRPRTTSELCKSLPDVPKATMYRHVALLADGGLLDVVGERRIHGAVERSYRLRPAAAVIDQQAAAAMSTDDHRRSFAIAMATLVAEFNAYLDRGDADPVRDSVSYIQAPLSLTRRERAELIAAIRKLVVRRGDGRGARRRQYLFSPVFFPLGRTDN